jgi:hypothetical protein
MQVKISDALHPWVFHALALQVYSALHHGTRWAVIGCCLVMGLGAEGLIT